MLEGARGEARPAPPAPARGRAGGALRRGLGHLTGALARMLTDRRTADGPGLLQRVDARAKLLGLGALVVATTLVHAPETLLGLLALAALLAVLSRVPFGRYAPVLLGAPLFSLLVAAPASLGVVTSGRPLLTLVPSAWAAAHGFAHGLVVTDAGLLVVARLVLRTATSVLFVVVLTATTGPERLLGALRALGIPRLFVMLLSMMERYLEVLMRAASDLHLARLSRTIVAHPPRRERALVAAGVGALYRRTRALGESVHLAMISRGFTGEALTLEAPRLAASDVAFALAAFALAVLVVGGPR